MRISDWSSDVCSSDLAAKEDALHIAEGKKRVCQRRDFCFLRSREIARAGLHDLAAGKEFERRRIGSHFGFYEHEQYLGPIIRGIKATSGFPAKSPTRHPLQAHADIASAARPASPPTWKHRPSPRTRPDYLERS